MKGKSLIPTCIFPPYLPPSDPNITTDNSNNETKTKKKRKKTMPPTILVAGATGNTGRSVVSTLSKLLFQTTPNNNNNNPLITKTHRILALTRTPQSPTAQQLASLPGVEIVEKSWPEITPEWLRSQHVVRAFIASHNQTNQFVEESAFHVACLAAGVEHVVRISTMDANVRPDCLAYYPRSHWAVEALLASHEFSSSSSSSSSSEGRDGKGKGMGWTSLRANVFSTFLLAGVVGFIQEFRAAAAAAATVGGTETEKGEKKKKKLRLLASRDAGVGVVHPDDVGAFAAHLLCQRDIAAHSGAKYVINGPEDIAGREIVRLVEGYIGVELDEEEDVAYEDLSFLDEMNAQLLLGGRESANVLDSIRYAAEAAFDGRSSRVASPTSPEVLEIAPPRVTPAQTLREMLGE